MDYLYVDNINEENSINYIKAKNPDVIYCFGWSQLIKNDIIKIPSKGVVGFHPAELPSNRGRHPIIWALVLGLKQTASTFFFITEKADEGDIISQEIVPIEYEDNAQTLYDKIMAVAVNQVKIFTKQFQTSSIARIKQDESRANVWRKRTKSDGKIDWRMSSRSIYYLVRALTKPYVGAHFEYGDQEYKVWSVKEIQANDYNNIEYGKVLKVISETSFVVKTGDGVLLIENCDPIKLCEGDYLL